jgi:hypothetical protein
VVGVEWGGGVGVGVGGRVRERARVVGWSLEVEGGSGHGW